MGNTLQEIRNVLSAVVREKVFRADVPYMVEQRNYITPKCIKSRRLRS